MAEQNGWKYCWQCSSLFFQPNGAGVCFGSASGHDARQSGDYTLVGDENRPGTQSGWKYCHKCLCLFYEAQGPGVCAAGGAHDSSVSGRYELFLLGPSRGTNPENAQTGWCCCNQCGVLCFEDSGQHRCPYDGNVYDSPGRHHFGGNYYILGGGRAFPPAPVIVEAHAHDHGFTGCGIVCRALFPLNYDQAIFAFKALKAAGMSEETARTIAQDAGQLAGALYGVNFGILAGLAATMVATGCALCAVDSAYDS